MIQLSKKIAINAIDYASQGNAVLGIRGSGKTYTATFIAENLMDEKIPIIVFDPIGVWRYLKVAESGKGYPVVVAGDDGDLPLTAANAADIVRAAMKENVSLIVDLYSMHLSKADWKKIVESCLRVLLYENKNHGLRHIFIEEAAEFCPQRVGPDSGRVYAEVEKLARMGGNASLGYTLINQRAEEVNKAVLELCDCLFLHRQKGRNSLVALEKWLNVADTNNAKQVISSISALGPGECWVWEQGSKAPEWVKIPKKKTIHPDRKNPIKLKPGSSVDVSKFVEKLNLSLKKENGEKEIKKVSKIASDEGKGMIETLIQSGKQKDEIIKEQGQAIKRLELAMEKIRSISSANVMVDESVKTDVKVNFAALPQNNGNHVTVSKARANNPAAEIIDNLPAGESKILIACASYPDGCRREQLTVLTGYKRSSRDAYIQRLSTKGYVQTGDRIRATFEGRAALGANFTPLPSGEKLQEHWLNVLPEGERKILDLLLDAHPDALERQELSEKTGYMRSSRDAYIQRMTAKELITTPSQGMVRASDHLFN
jgi:hypothetical protein